jgi:hypothetical protein
MVEFLLVMQKKRLLTLRLAQEHLDRDPSGFETVGRAQYLEKDIGRV